MSVVSYLEKRASGAVLSKLEESSIKRSISSIKGKLSKHFGPGLKNQFQFGSSTHGTILPRSMDAESDVDYMVVFSRDSLSPQTYLDQLRRFAEKYYNSAEIKQSSPSIVLQLDHISFDLVPALERFFFDGYRIPDGPNAWQNTNPNDFNGKLTKRNNERGSKIKPTIRLMKYWNALNGYIFNSYALENRIVDTDYWFATNQKDYLLKAFANLALENSEAQWKRDRLNKAREAIAAIKKYEKAKMLLEAEAEVKKLIPEG